MESPQRKLTATPGSQLQQPHSPNTAFTKVKTKQNKKQHPGSTLIQVGDNKFYFDRKRKILSFRFFAKLYNWKLVNRSTVVLML